MPEGSADRTALESQISDMQATAQQYLEMGMAEAQQGGLTIEDVPGLQELMRNQIVAIGAAKTPAEQQAMRENYELTRQMLNSILSQRYQGRNLFSGLGDTRTGWRGVLNWGPNPAQDTLPAVR